MKEILHKNETLEQEKVKMEGKFKQMTQSFQNVYNYYFVLMYRNLVLTGDNRRLESRVFMVSKMRLISNGIKIK